jgi:8-oxo-dGTP diphosphatase
MMGESLRPKLRVPVVEVVAGLLRRVDGHVLLAERPAGRHYRGCWELPGGKCDPGETFQQALLRELEEELGIQVVKARPLITVQHGDERLHIVLNVYVVDEWRGEPYGAEGQQLCWREPTAVDRAMLTPADQLAFPSILLPDHYAITPEEPRERLAARCLAGLATSGGLVQMRAHHLHDSGYEECAGAVVAAMSASDRSRLMLNSTLETAERMGVGCHLNRWRLAELTAERVANWRRHAASGAWLAASCHDLESLRRAEALGVDFAVLSPVAATRSHPGREPLGVEQFYRLVRQVNLPVYGLGGLSPADKHRLWEAGAQGVAGISSFWPVD